MGTRQFRMSRSAALIALLMGCVVCAPAAAQDLSRLVGLSVDESSEGEVRIRLQLDRMAGWSSFRGEDGALTVELASAQPAPSLVVPTTSGELIGEISVDFEAARGTTLVRVTDGETEHEIIPIDNGLEIVVRELEAAPEMIAAPMETEPAAEAEPMAAPAAGPVAEAAPEPAPAATPEAAATGAAVQPTGTVDQPYRSDADGPLAATQVVAIETATEGGEVSVYIRGDGSFSYSAFSLGDPDRFVIDLPGVMVGVDQSRVGVDESSVKQVRLAQFQSDPEPVARVVFDLWSADVPWVEPVVDGLRVHFGSQPVEVTQADLPGAMDEPMEMAGDERAVDEPMDGAVEPPVEMIEAMDEETPVEAVEQVAEEQPAEVMETPEVADESDYQPMEAEEVAIEAEAPEMMAEPVPEPVAAATESAYFNEQDLTVTTGEAQGQPNAVAGFQRQQMDIGTRQYTGEPIDLSLQESDVRDVLRSLAQISGLNLVIQPGVTGRVTVEFVQVPWDQALEQILRINNLGYEVEGNIMRVAPLSQLREEAEERQRLAQARAAAVPLTTVLQRISYARAADIARILAARGGIMSQRGSVVVDARTNTLIIKELPAYVDTVLSVIENLDIPEPQVMIEARIIETTKRFTRTLGIEWGFTGTADAEHGNTTGLEFPNNIAADGGVSLLTGGRNGFLDLTLGNVLNTFNLDVALQAAENEGLINILSEPRVATLNNERATIQSGLQIPIQTVANNTVSVQFVNATLRLDVTPQVTADGTVLMEIRIQKREPQPAFAVPGAANAPIATKEAQTRVIVRDGGTTVIGGIYEVSTDHGEDRVPGLGKTKGISWLFKNRRRNDENEELLIFITPRVIRL